MVLFSLNHLIPTSPFFFQEEILEASLIPTGHDFKGLELVEFETNLLDLYMIFKGCLAETFKDYLKCSMDKSPFRYHLSGNNCLIYSPDTKNLQDNAVYTLEIPVGYKKASAEARRCFLNCISPKCLPEKALILQESLFKDDICIPLPNGLIYFRVVTASTNSDPEQAKGLSETAQMQGEEVEDSSLESRFLEQKQCDVLIAIMDEIQPEQSVEPEKGPLRAEVKEKKPRKKGGDKEKKGRAHAVKNKKDLDYLDSVINKNATRLKKFQNGLKELAKTNDGKFEEAIIKHLDETFKSKNSQMQTLDFFQYLQSSDLVLQASPHIATYIEKSQAGSANVRALFTLFLYLAPPVLGDLEAREKSIKEQTKPDSHFKIARRLAWQLYSTDEFNKEDTEFACTLSHYFNLKFTNKPQQINKERFIASCWVMFKALLEPQGQNQPTNSASLYIAISTMIHIPPALMKAIGIEDFFKVFLKAARAHHGVNINNTTFLTQLYRLVITIPPEVAPKEKLMSLVHDELVAFLSTYKFEVQNKKLNAEYELLFTQMMQDFSAEGLFNEKKLQQWMSAFCAVQAHASYQFICMISYLPLPTKSYKNLEARFKIILKACSAFPGYILDLDAKPCTLLGVCLDNMDTILKRVHIFPKSLFLDFQTKHKEIIFMDRVKNDSATLEVYKKLEPELEILIRKYGKKSAL